MSAPAAAVGSATLLFDGLSVSRGGLPVLHEVSLSIREGEVVGLAGLVGSGRTELARCLAGADPVDSGTIRLDGRECRIRSPIDAIRSGIAFVPESRKEQGLFMDLSLAANTTFAHMRTVSSRFGFVRPLVERSRSRSLLQFLSVEPASPAARTGNLSGGNQQKVLFARWLFNGRPPRTQGARPEQKVDLPTPVPLYITYLTAVPSGSSIVYFDDFYGKDRAQARQFAGL